MIKLLFMLLSVFLLGALAGWYLAHWPPGDNLTGLAHQMQGAEDQIELGGAESDDALASQQSSYEFDLAAIDALQPEERLVAIHQAIKRRGGSFELTLMLVDYYIRQSQYVYALDHLLSQDAIPQTRVQELVFAQRLQSLVAAHLQASNDNRANSEQGSLRFFQRLVATFPEKATFQMYLASVLIESGQTEAALVPLSQITNDAGLGEQARALSAEIEASLDRVAAGWVQIPLIARDGQFIATVVLGDRKGDGQTVRLLLDTGAGMTVIRSDVLETLGYSLGETMHHFVTAGGVVQAPVINLGSLALSNDMVARELVVGALPMEFQAEVQGLLGMDVLSQFEFRIDQENSLLLLRYR